MRMRLIRGTFHVEGFEPDGDSVRFLAKNPQHWNTLDGPAVRLNTKGMAQLRFEAIDALETHYRAGGKTFHQPLEFANAATHAMLKLLRIEDATLRATARMTLIDGAVDATPGYILTRATERFRRPVAFVYHGKPEVGERDGGEVEVSPERLKHSANFQMLKTGMAYPTFYRSLYYEYRKVFAAAAKQARQRKAGVWAVDVSKAVPLADVEALQTSQPIFPKLFRRLVTHFAAAGTLIGAKQFLAENRDEVVLASLCHFTHFDELVTETGGTLSLTGNPEDMIFSG